MRASTLSSADQWVATTPDFPVQEGLPTDCWLNALAALLGVLQHPYQHRSERPVLLAVDQESNRRPPARSAAGAPAAAVLP